MGEKLENFTASFSEAIAQRRGRNVEWAARAVRESVSITSDEAAKTAVVDFVAHDLDEVVTLADGRWVEIGDEWRALALGVAVRGLDGHVRTRTYSMRLGQRILNVIADPNIAYLLMMAGVLGLYIEFTHPGVVFPGVAGAICHSSASFIRRAALFRACGAVMRFFATVRRYRTWLFTYANRSP